MVDSGTASNIGSSVMDRFLSGRADALTRLPPAVQSRILHQQDKSEQLIGWIQLGIISTFAVLYILSQRLNGTLSGAWILTPVAIAIYFILTIVRLILSYRMRLNFWILSVSVVADMALLYGLIWSFHLQYQQPASFYLKAPTLLYVFIFIALRALRFEARYVVLAGLAAAIGWAGMIAYVLTADRGNSVITHDYVHYLTSNSILLGAEFDKIISILVVTAIMALAIRRARGLLVRSVVENHAKESLSRFFSPEIAERIGVEGEKIQAGMGEIRDVAVLNIDIRGFTGLAAAIHPDEVMKILAVYQSKIVAVIERNGGSIDKFLGDGIMATFGASMLQKDYAARAMMALEECMQETAAGLPMPKTSKDREPLAVNGAIAAGTVVVGAVGSDRRLEYTVIGDAVNLSAKLEKYNKSLGTRALVQKAAYDLALVQGYNPRDGHSILSDVSVAGIDRPIDLVVLA